MQAFDVGIQTLNKEEQTTVVGLPKASTATLSDDQPAASPTSQGNEEIYAADEKDNKGSSKFTSLPLSHYY